MSPPIATSTATAPPPKGQSLLETLNFIKRKTNPDSALFACGLDKPFDVKLLATAFCQKCSSGEIQQYITGYGKTEVKANINSLVNSHHVVTYAIAYRDLGCLRMLLEYGVDLKHREFGNVPIFALAIMLPHWELCNTTEIVRLLLAHGASPHSISQDTWVDYINSPAPSPEQDLTEWRTGEWRELLVETMHLSIRYSLWKASRLQDPPTRKLQISEAKGIVSLLRIPNHIIGQEPAVKEVIDGIHTHIAMDMARPLVLAFCGPSGHGKTELTSSMGSLLSSDFIEVDCTQLTSVFSLLGMTAGYKETEIGSPLNNHLVRNRGQRSVVFLDEFDKTEREVREALMKVMDSRAYIGRPKNLQVDCTKMIWILATNKGDTATTEFYAKHIEKRSEEDMATLNIVPLQKTLRKMLSSEYSPAVCGRIDAIIAFFPFGPRDQAVLAHKFILAMQDQIRKPIDLKPPVLRLVGHCLLRIVDDGNLCQHLAREGYVQELGARSLLQEMGKVVKKFTKAHDEVGEAISEASNSVPFEKYTAQLVPIEEGVEDIAAFHEREKEVYA